MKRNEVNMNKVTPMMKQYLEIKEQNSDIIIFFRLGDFYEMFFEDALLVSKECELTLTGKNAGLDEKIPMCGVPHHSANVYIEMLVEKGYKVGICEQLEEAKNVKGIVKRDIVQIISSGTSFDSISSGENNYVGALLEFEHMYGLCYADITTGEINATLIEKDITKLLNVVINNSIKEIILFPSVDINVFTNLKKNNILISYFEKIEEINDYISLYEFIDNPSLVKVVKYLLSYVNHTQKRILTHFTKVVIKKQKEYLIMDVHTKRNLELVETLRQKEKLHSLLWLLDKTKTAMGSRTLKKYIEEPLVDINLINERLNMVSILNEQFMIKAELQDLLNEVYDLERLSGRIAFGNANGRDLLQLKKSLKVLPNIKNILSELKFNKTINEFSELYKLLESSINENPPISIKEGYLIKEGFNKELDELKELRKGGKDFVARFELEEKERTGIKTLKVGYNRIFGYYIEVSKGSIKDIKEEYGYERRQTLANCERYISPILKEKESIILNAEEKIINLEYDLFINIRESIKQIINELQITAKVISEIDVLQSFSTVAEENRYVRPNLVVDSKIRLIENRHPVVEKVISTEYVPNDILMGENTNILLITGPNMAGKSTYMRQLAITVIMAQIGSFVPSNEATLPVFDAIFTRIGASDDLVSGESTFMVEMNEANRAITTATKNSLILFDELGRGTATFDGMSLAQAIIEYIHNNIKAKTLFSTHYHELTDLENSLSSLKNVHVSAYLENNNLTFLHKVKEGSVDKSYGIYVAKLANLPTSLIKRANDILSFYEQKEIKTDKKIQESLVFDNKETEKSVVSKVLDEIDPLTLSPMDALNLLFELKEKNKKEL